MADSSAHVITTVVPVVRIGPAPAPRQPGRWDDAQTRDRQGRIGAFWTGQLARVAPAGAERLTRLLTPYQRRKLYLTTPDVRACVDSIARRVATWNWNVEPDLDARDPRYEQALAEAKTVARWLAAPNEDGETWQEVLTKFVTDLLIDDAGAMELVEDARGKLVELNVLQGSTIFPVVDQHGRVQKYVQDPLGAFTYDANNPASGSAIQPGVPTSGAVVHFDTDQILYLRLFPNTDGPIGYPLLESLVNECVIVLLASDHLVNAIDADEIPPGVFVVGGLADVAASQARADLAQMRGKDHKIRLISSEVAGAGGVDAKWVEFRRTLKDLAFREAVDDIRRVIWRVFGVMPIEMGATQDMPRAVGQVQVDVSQSHLLEPILELVEAKITARIVPRRTSPEWAGVLRFRFDRTAKQTSEQDAAAATADGNMLDRGVLTVNEARQKRGLRPFGPEGDVPLVVTPTGRVPLVVVAGMVVSSPASPTPENVEPGPAKGGVEEPEEALPGPGEEAPGDAPSRGRPMRRGLMADGDLPSDWQPAGRFRGRRTVDLVALASAVADYQRDAEPLYADAGSAAVGAIRAFHEPGDTSRDEAEQAMARVQRALDRLATRWSQATHPRYLDVARSSAARVVRWTGWERDASVTERQGEAYHDTAMGYLSASGGLLDTLGDLSRAILQRVTAPVGRSAHPPDRRAIDVDDDDLVASVVAALEEEAGVVGAAAGASALAMVRALTPDSSTDDVASAMAAVWDAQRYRIGNWAGKLVELANEVLTATLTEQAMADNTAPGRDPTRPPTEWYGEFVAVGDTQTCPVCLREGARGLVPLAQIVILPGSQATNCKARCRCVVVVHTKAEVDSGDAQPLSGAFPGNTPL